MTLTRDRRVCIFETVLCLSIPLLTFLAFLPALRGDWLNWDDDANFLENPHFRGLSPANLRWMFSAFHMGHYQPLSWVTLGADNCVWGMKAFGYHLTNVLFHAANAALFYLLAVKLFAAALRLEGRPGVSVRLCAAFAALAFSVHPMRVEAVAWITERRDVLNAFFVLLCLLFYVEAYRTEIPGQARRRWYFASLGLYACSLLAKSMSMTLPFVLVALDAYPLRRLGGWRREEALSYGRRSLSEKGPFIALAAGAAVLAFHVQRQTLTSWETFGLSKRIAVVGYGIFFYVRKTLVPVALLPLYELDRKLNPLGWEYVGSACAAIGLTVLVLVLRKRYPAAVAAWAAYLVMLSPVSGISQNGPQLVADRYSYLVCMPFAVLSGALILHLVRDGRESFRPRLIGALALCAAASILATLAFLTYRQTRIWRSSLVLWSYVVSHDPQSGIAHLNMGAALFDAGQKEAAEAHYREALRLRPRYAKAHNNLGKVALEKGNYDEAVVRFARAIELEPNLARAHYNLGSALLRRGEPAKAAKALEETLRIDPDLDEARVNLAAAYLAAGEPDKALHEYELALAENPDDPDCLYNLGTIRLRRGETKPAIELFRKSIRFRADFAPAHFNLGNALLRDARGDEAIPAFHEAIRLDPASAAAYVNLAAACLAKGDTASAIAQYEAVLRVQPDLAIAHYNLGFTLLESGRFKEAAAALREAVRTSPDDADAHYHLAVALYYAKDYALAREHLERARALGRSLDPRFVDALNAASSEPASAASTPSP